MRKDLMHSLIVGSAAHGASAAQLAASMQKSAPRLAPIDGYAGFWLGLLRTACRWTLGKVMMPMRVIIPPTTSEYLSLTKNSSLGAAIAYPELVSIFAGTALNQAGRAIEIVSAASAKLSGFMGLSTMKRSGSFMA